MTGTPTPAAAPALADLPPFPQPGDVPAILRWQAAACGKGAPLYQRLLTAAGADAEAGGPTVALLAPYADRPSDAAPGLRLLAAVHRLVLAGEAPELARFYPSAGGSGPAESVWPAFRQVLVDRGDAIAGLMKEPVQTNETGRSAALYAGLLALVHHTGLPVRLLEFGASAGLNLRADHFAYRTTDGALLGDPTSPLVLEDPWRGAAPVPLNTPIRVVERRGCDPAPVDPADPAARARLEALIWADHADRLARIRAAFEVAARVPAPVDQASDTVAWLADRLAEPVPGTVTVVWHSVVRPYVAPAAWEAIRVLLVEVGEHATSDAPLAVLGLEPEADERGRLRVAARLTSWPGGEARLLGTADGHGTPFTWHAGE